MKRSLSLSLRPKSFVEMFGQQRVTSAIRKRMKLREPRAWLFSGESGSGKTTLMRIVAASLNCTHQKVFGSPCKDCYRRREQRGLVEINASALNGVDAIKELAINSEYAPNSSDVRRRIFMLDEAQLLTKQAQNVLLKYFEDAPRTTTWMIGTTEPDAIIRALRRRCARFGMRPLYDQEVEAYVQWAAAKAGVKRDLSEFIEYIHQNTITSPGFIVESLENYAAGLDPDVAVVGAECNINTKRLCNMILQGDWKPVRYELDRAQPSDAKLIRGAVLGYFRKVMVNAKPYRGVKLTLVAQAIQDFARIGWSDDNTMLAQLTAVCYQWTKKFPG
jgi:type II secretory pathway predicted ATPase ExeA